MYAIRSYYAIQAFDTISEVVEIIVVTNYENEIAVKKLINDYNFSKNIVIAIGGKTRQESVFNGFQKVSSQADFIAIHDGARPLISVKSIIKVFENAEKYKASTLGVPVKDTIKTVKNGFICDTPNRNMLYITQTPQVFEKELYRKGYINAIQNNLDFTDDCQLVEAIGANIYMTVGQYTNIKITTPEDIKLAEIFLKEVQ